MVDAILYETEYCVDFLRGYYKKTNEIFLPSLNIAFSYTEDLYGKEVLNVFKLDQPRNSVGAKHSWVPGDTIAGTETPITNITLSQPLVDDLTRIIKANELQEKVKCEITDLAISHLLSQKQKI